MGGEERQIGHTGDDTQRARIAPLLPASDGTAGAAAHATIRVRPSLSGPGPVRVIVTSGPGGQSDTTARLFAQKLTENLGQSFYIENMGGGGGNIAMGVAARAAPTVIRCSQPPAAS